MRSTIRCGACSTCLTLLVSPDSAGGGLGRARVISRRWILFSFFRRNYCSDPSYLFLPRDTYQSDMCHVRTWVGEHVGLSPWASLHGGSIPSVLFFYLCAVFSSLFVSRRVVSQPSTSRTGTRYYTAVRRIIYLACIYTQRELLLLLLLPLLCTGVVAAAAVRHRLLESKNCCWFIVSDSIYEFFLSLHSNTTYF